MEENGKIRVVPLMNTNNAVEEKHKCNSAIALVTGLHL